MPRWLLPLQSALLAVAFTWPAAARLGTEAVGGAESDTFKHLWTLWWMRRELWSGVPGLRTDLVDFPAGMDLWPIEPLHGPVAALVPLGVVALSNLLAIGHVALLGLAAGWLGRLVTRDDLGALTAGALAQGCAFTAFTLHVGVGELREFWWVPLGLGCLVRAWKTRAPAWFAALSACLVGATLSCFYHGFFLATAVALWALCTLRPSGRLLLGYALAAGVGVAVIVPVLGVFSASYAPADGATRESFSAWMARPFQPETYRAAAMDLAELLGPRNGARATADRQALAYTGGRYLGWGTVLLATIGLAAAPRKGLPWLGVALGGVLLSLGTVLWWKGALVEPRVVLPLTWVNRALAWAAEPMNFPARFVGVAMIALAVLSALAVARWRRLAWLVPVALVDVARHDLVPWPRATAALPDMAGLAAPEGAVADLTPVLRAQGRATNREGASILSFFDPESRTRGIVAQIQLDRPTSTVPLERADHWAADGLAWTAALPLGDALAGEPVDDAGMRASLWLLRDRGFGAVLLTHGCNNGPDARAKALLDRWFGPPSHAACATVWPVPDTTATPAESQSWRASQAERAARLAPPRMGRQFAGDAG